jgi:predicted enzyme related to lactoylglutathione lyase
MVKSPGSVCHLELYARQLDESAKFYSDLFLWEISPHDSGYLFWEDPDGLSGGFTTAGAPVTNPAATFYMKVESIPDMLIRIKQNGGIVIRERTEIGKNKGFYALFRDPAGNNVGLWCAS